MYVSIINGETSNHMIHEKEAAKCEGIFGMANSAIINGETSNHMIHEKEAAKCEGIFGMANSAVILGIHQKHTLTTCYGTAWI